jgi:L-asparaginase
MPNKSVLIVSMGGTVRSRYDPVQRRVVPDQGKFDLLDQLQIEGIELHYHEFMNVPSSHLDPQAALSLSEWLEKSAASFNGIVVLQGTDTLEEFAYLVHLITRVDKPIVFTGAMKGRGDSYEDGLGNIRAAVLTAVAEDSVGRGMLVVFNEKIFLPQEVYKADTTNVDAFQSPVGPVGIITHDRVCYFRPPQRQDCFEKSIESNVEMFKTVLGGSARYLRQAIEQGARGIVLEAFGAGNIPPDWAEAVALATSRSIPVVIASRSVTGSAMPLYDYPGGGKSLHEIGAIFSRRLSAPKARIKLMVVLGQRSRLNSEDLMAQFS